MPKSLVVVESPAKAKTLSKYLGRQFTVKASMGHVKDLPKSKLGVKIGKRFEPEYVVIAGKKNFLDDIKKISKTVDNIYLAPDPDREGEAIAWHIAEEISKKANGKVKRVLFNEITKKAVLEAINAPQELNRKKYESQQARRILDRLVGYQISPILWQKVRRGLSAGRVQSVAVRLICDREADIKAFVPEEYWTVEIDLLANTPPPFRSYLFRIDGKKAEIKTADQANAIKDELYKLGFKVSKIDKKTVSRSPQPPFITSRLQQEASRRLRYTAKRTMLFAQQLYEGIEIGDEGLVGLITYMRTDSTRLSGEAVDQARNFIKNKFGENYLPGQPRSYVTKQRSQDAHEAIRPTSVEYPPEKVKKYLSKELYSLYELIWNRFIASQMNDAQFIQTATDIEGGRRYVFRATGSVLKFDGFMALYVEKMDELIETEECDILFPKIEEGDQFKLQNAYAIQHFTKSKPHFSESSLIKELEERGIGRPSTYASIISNIQSKKYVKKEEGRFYPTDLGTLVTGLLVSSFPKILDVDFTARMEDELDKVEYGEKDWQELLKDFYGSFKDTLVNAKKEMRNVKREEVKTDVVCEKCGKPMIVKWGRNGHFIACSGYPECKNTKEIKQQEDGKIVALEREATGEKCEKCGSNMIIRSGRFGRFLACEKYPECKSTKSITTGIKCPMPGCDGSLAMRKTKKGRRFYGCTSYPKCKFATWYPPVNEACPKCSNPIMIDKPGKDGHSIRACVKEGCDFEKQI